MKWWVILLTLLPSELAFSQGGNQKKCYPYCGEYSIDELKKLDLSAQLPHRPSLYRYRVKGEHQGHRVAEVALMVEVVAAYDRAFRDLALDVVGWVSSRV